MKRISIILGLACAVAVVAEAVAQQDDIVAEPVSTFETLSSTEVFTECGGTECDLCCCCSRGVYAGFEVTFLSLQPTHNRALLEEEEQDDMPPGFVDEFDYGFEGAPRLWVGYQLDNCWGVRGRYWQFDAGDRISFVDLENMLPEEVVKADSEFEAYTVDLELTRRLQRGCWDFLASVGARQASISHAHQGQVFSLDAMSDEADHFALSRRIEGTGITAAMEGWRQIGCSRLALFWNARGSVVWADNTAAALFIEVDDDNDGPFAGATDERDEIVIGELQIGLQWSAPIECLGAELFLRGAFEYQIWDLNSQQLDLAGIDADDDPLRVDALGRGDLNFYGAAFSAGILR